MAPAQEESGPGGEPGVLGPVPDVPLGHCTLASSLPSLHRCPDLGQSAGPPPWLSSCSEEPVGL